MFMEKQNKPYPQISHKTGAKIQVINENHLNKNKDVLAKLRESRGLEPKKLVTQIKFKMFNDTL